MKYPQSNRIRSQLLDEAAPVKGFRDQRNLPLSPRERRVLALPSGNCCFDNLWREATLQVSPDLGQPG